MTQEVEQSGGFLDSVLQPAGEPDGGRNIEVRPVLADGDGGEGTPRQSRHRQPRSGSRRWPADPASPGETPEDGGDDPSEAYLPDVVAPRIREALRGGNGLAGTPKRYGLLVATLVGLASLPTWVVLRAGLDDIAPAFREPTGVLIAVPPAPEPVTVRGLHHARPPRQAAPALPAPVAKPKAAAPRAMPVVRLPERSVVTSVSAERPVAVKRPAVKPAKKQTAPVQGIPQLPRPVGADVWAPGAWKVKLPVRHPFLKPVRLKPVQPAHIHRIRLAPVKPVRIKPLKPIHLAPVRIAPLAPVFER